MMLHIKYQGSRPCGFRQEEFLCFPHISQYKTYDPRDKAFLPHGHNLNEFVRDPLGFVCLL